MQASLNVRDPGHCPENGEELRGSLRIEDIWLLENMTM